LNSQEKKTEKYSAAILAVFAARLSFWLTTPTPPKSEGLGRTGDSLNPNKITKLFFGENLGLIL
jgi:hypothetical protein